MPERPTLDPDGTFSGTGPRVMAGATWRWLGVKVGWSRFGTEDRFNAHFQEWLCVGEGCAPGEGVITDNVEQRGSAAWATLMPTAQFGAFEVFAKVGIARTTIESRQMTRHENRRRETETDAMVGVGAALQLGHGFGLRAEIERLGSNARQYGVSLSYSF